MKKILMALVIATVSFSAFAAENEYPVRKNSVETNNFWANWFISLNGGAQVAPWADEIMDTLTPTGSLSIGKWFTPGLGLRLQATAPFYSTNDAIQAMGVAGYAEAMFNLTNMFHGYKADRVYNFIPFIGFGRAWRFADDENSVDASNAWTPWTFGINNTFRLSNAWQLNLELFCRQFNDIMKPYNTGDARNWNAGAQIGVIWNWGKNTFEASPDMVAVAALHAAEIAALNEALANAADENKALKDELAKKPKEVVKEKVVKDVLAAPQSVFFAFNSSKVASKKEVINLQSLADMAKNNGAKLKVTGYADSATGSAAYNQTLSEQRANAVKKELVKLGVAEDQIVTEGKGGVADVKPAAYNRRAIIEAL